MARRLKSTNPRKLRKSGASKIRRVTHEPSVSHLRRPMGMDVKAWQTQLRRQFGRAQSFKLKNLGDQPVFSDFQVTNPQNGNRYRVAIRGARAGENFCACPDFATNDRPASRSMPQSASMRMSVSFRGCQRQVRWE